MSDLEQELVVIPMLSLAELADHWHAKGLGSVPRLSLRLLQRLYAQLRQEQALGGLPASVARELGNAEPIIGKCRAPSPPAPRQVMLSAGRPLTSRTVSSIPTWYQT